MVPKAIGNDKGEARPRRRFEPIGEDQREDRNACDDGDGGVGKCDDDGGAPIETLRSR